MVLYVPRNSKLYLVGQQNFTYLIVTLPFWGIFLKYTYNFVFDKVQITLIPGSHIFFP